MQALYLYASTKLDFGDAHIIASMQQQGSPVLYFYDTGFDRIKGITWRKQIVVAQYPTDDVQL